MSVCSKDGLEATRTIRALGFDKLIVGVTGNAMEDDVAAFLAAGADTVFTKPLKLQQLIMLFKHVDLHGSRSQADRKLRITDISTELYSF